MNRSQTFKHLYLSISVTLLVAAATGCSVAPTAAGNPTSPPAGGDSSTASGNWQGNLTASQGKKPLGVISGSINQSGGNTASGQFTTAVFRIQNACYAETAVPSQGFVKETSISLNSFAVEHQYLTLNGTVAKDGNTISGTYAANGGCADGSAGSLSLQRYAPFTGTYASPAGQDHGVTMTTSQSDGADGTGFFPVAATVKFINFSCFTEGIAMMTNTPKISGASFDFFFTTNDPAGSTIRLSGVIDINASHVTNYSYIVAGGACDGMSGSGALVRI